MVASLRPEPTRAIERSHVVLFKQPRVKLSSTCITIGLRVGELEIFESELSLLTVKNSPLVCQRAAARAEAEAGATRCDCTGP